MCVGQWKGWWNLQTGCERMPECEGLTMTQRLKRFPRSDSLTGLPAGRSPWGSRISVGNNFNAFFSNKIICSHTLWEN